MVQNHRENYIGKNMDAASICLENSRILTSPDPGEEVCITGISGSFPNSRNVQEFRDNLLNKIDMVDKESRWKPEHPEIPERSGTIYDVDQFDPGFFGIHHRQAESMDPMHRISMEKMIEAICDAGYHPSELAGTKTGVFMAIASSESVCDWYGSKLGPQKFIATGAAKSMQAKRISYYLGLKGPSLTVDTACSSSLYALENAYRAIRTGVCDMALIGGSNLTLLPEMTLHFVRLGVLSKDGTSKTFDESADGYVRAETICCMLLQKAKDSRRIYSTIIHAQTNCDGFKEQSINFPSSEVQRQLLGTTYTECNVDPRSLSYMEAHGTGTRVGDPEECNAIAEVICKGRDEVILMGSVKSNMGHSETASGLCSVTKVIIAMETGLIPPNLHYSKPREGITCLEDGRIKVVTEKTPFQDDRGLIGISSFGFGGANAHVLLKWNTKVKVNDGLPNDNLPRLVCVSGRVPEAVTSFIEHINSRKLDVEYIQLLHEVFRKDFHPHPYRGYTIASKEGGIKSSVNFFKGITSPLVVAFGSFEDSWQPIIKSLLAFPVFSDAVQRVQKVLNSAKTGVNIMDLINNQVVNFHPFVKNILGNIVLQIGIVELLNALELTPDFIIGYAFGELGCAYLDGSLSLDQTILAALQIALHLKDICEPASTFMINLSETQAKKLLPASLEIIWKIDEHNVTISGTSKITQKFVESLQDIGVTVKHISSASNSWLSRRRFSKIESALLPKLREIIPNPKNRTGKWLSPSTEKTASPEFFIKCFHSMIDFHDLSSYFVEDEVILELGLGGFGEVLKHTIQCCVNHVKFETNNGKDGVTIFLDAVGSLYEFGFNPQIQNLYPKVPYPVSRGTPMLSPLIKWNHKNGGWYVVSNKIRLGGKEGKQLLYSLKNTEHQYMEGHMIDGRNLFPATGYLHAVWEVISQMNSSSYDYERLTCVVFENCRFKRATTISKELTDLNVMIQKQTGNFEVIEDEAELVSGRVQFLKPHEVEKFNLSLPTGTNKSQSKNMKSKDIYKELRLRGYNYKGVFKGLQECNLEATIAWLKWDGNYVSFMDNMLQMKILQLDSRLLYVPIGIKRLTINAVYHTAYVKQFGDNPLLPVYIYKEADIIRCGGIEIKGLMASSIPKRKILGEPVLEKYEFVPNVTQFNSIKESTIVNMQIGLENQYAFKIKVIEILDESTEANNEPLGPLVHDVYCDQPLVQTQIFALSSEKLELPNVTVENKTLTSDSNCNLIIGSRILQRPMILQQVFGALKERGFILSREAENFDLSSLTKQDLAAIEIMTIHHVGSETLVYFRQAIKPKEFRVINVSIKDEEFSWLPILQTSLKNDANILIYSQNEDCSGILGLINCIRKEPGGMNVICFIIFDKMAPPFDPKLPFYATQISKNMSINIYKNGQWGTYRHLPLNQIEEVKAEHTLVNPLTRGDLSSLKWIEGNLNSKTILPAEQILVKVHFASLNFRDVMTASGRINADIITMDRTRQECVQGLEFSGMTSCGRRVMGMVSYGALSTLVAADRHLLWDIPEHWTMEQAASVPVIYGTVLYALIHRANLRKGQSLLIHSGTGGVGQAAINIALAYGCTVYTTVGTQEKRDFIKKTFPQLTDRYIGCSRDLSFETLIKQETKGRGVDIVLNSLAEEKLIASVRCLAKGGKFLEIGKFDIANNNLLGIQLLAKDCSFHGIMLDKVFDEEPYVKKRIGTLVDEGIRSGAIKPLNQNIFKRDEVEQAFRFMASGKHVGKVMIQVREDEDKADSVLTKALPRFYCNAERSHIIIGGLGGLGLELADWLVLRGATKLVLTSRSGITTGYQSSRVNLWQSYGVTVKISTADITTEEGCQELISEAQELGSIESIFNLAVVLKDSIVENQSPESFRISFGPKATATKYLDKITRQNCSDLRDFVVFSSVSCGRGNAGQTNYGMANSIMERICEKRRVDGFPALAVEWGAIGDVGLVAEMMEDNTQIEIGGTLQQRLVSCLQVLDIFLRQKEAAVVSSIVVAIKKGGGDGGDIVDVLLNILGQNKQSISPHASLAELGMDSMSAIEIKQILECDFDVFLTSQDLRTITLAKLQEMQQSKYENEVSETVVPEHDATGMETVIKYLGDESQATMPLIKLPSLDEGRPEAPQIFCFPGIEGFATTLKPLAANLKASVIGIQFPYKDPSNTYADFIQEAVLKIEKMLRPNESLKIIAYSWGSIIALEVLSILERKGLKGNLICIDGAPEMVQEMCKQQLQHGTEAEVETLVMCQMFSIYISADIILRNKENIYSCKSFDERLKLMQELSSNESRHSPEYQRKVALALCTRVKELLKYSPSYPKIHSPVRLFKPTNLSLQNFPEDYKLVDLCANIKEIKIFEGNHLTVMENVKMAKAVAECFELDTRISSLNIETGKDQVSAIMANGS